MSVCTNLPSMDFFEKYVNDVLPCNVPSHVGETLEVVLPQRFNPVMMSKKDRKSKGRPYQVSLIFVAELWRAQIQMHDRLKWKYYDLKVLELV